MDFLIDNWQFITTLLFGLLSFVLFFIKKKKIVVEDSLLNGIYSYAIELINAAECKFLVGSDKKQFVIDGLKEKFPESTKYFDEVFKSDYRFADCKASDDVFGRVVEMILTTPQRKEHKNEK